MNNDSISRSELKEAINTYDTFACLPDGKLYPVRELERPEMFETYIHVEDVIKAIDNSLSVDISKEVWNKSNELLNKRLSYLERPQSSLERPLYEGVLFVDDYGISKVIEIDENGLITAQMVIPRDTFIEAYNKFIKGE